MLRCTQALAARRRHVQQHSIRKAGTGRWRQFALHHQALKGQLRNRSVIFSERFEFGLLGRSWPSCGLSWLVLWLRCVLSVKTSPMLTEVTQLPTNAWIHQPILLHQCVVFLRNFFEDTKWCCISVWLSQNNRKYIQKRKSKWPLSRFFEHYNRILLCDWVLEHCSVCLIDGVSCHNAFEFYLDSTTLGTGALLCSSVITSVTGKLTIVLRMCL